MRPAAGGISIHLPVHPCTEWKEQLHGAVRYQTSIITRSVHRIRRTVWDCNRPLWSRISHIASCNLSPKAVTVITRIPFMYCEFHKRICETATFRVVSLMIRLMTQRGSKILNYAHRHSQQRTTMLLEFAQLLRESMKFKSPILFLRTFIENVHANSGIFSKYSRRFHILWVQVSWHSATLAWLQIKIAQLKAHLFQETSYDLKQSKSVVSKQYFNLK